MLFLSFLAGAMRIPCDADGQYEGQHYLTNGYIKNFNLPIKNFPNYDENAVSCIYGFREKTKSKFIKSRHYKKFVIKFYMFCEVRGYT